MSDKNIYENSSEIAQMVFAYDDLSIPSHLKSKLDLAIEYKRQKKYLKALEIYYNDLIPELPNHPVILFSLAKLVLTFGHLGLALQLFRRVINFEEALQVNIYKMQALEYCQIIIDWAKGREKLLEVIELMKRVSGQKDFFPDFSNQQLAVQEKFENEYEYLKYIFKNKKERGFFGSLFAGIFGILFFFLFD